jgi:hypothetical protein
VGERPAMRRVQRIVGVPVLAIAVGNLRDGQLEAPREAVKLRGAEPSEHVRVQDQSDAHGPRKGVRYDVLRRPRGLPQSSFESPNVSTW